MMDKKILIIDISSHQDPALFDYDLLAKQVNGVILRAGYGTGSPKWGWVGADPAFETHYRELANRGVPLGAYHYICEYVTAEDQANVFLEAVAGKKFKLGYWCDVEYEKGAEKLTGNQVIRYMTLVEAELGKIGIYTGHWCWKDIMGDEYARYADRKAWISAYTASPDNYIPHGWKTFWMWQYTSTGRLASYNGGLNNIDKNMFNGTREEFNRWVDGNMIMTIPALSQKDDRWRYDQLGTSNTTIGGYGCLITSVSMMLKYFGFDTDPSRLNKLLKENGGFHNGNLFEWGTLERLFPGVSGYTRFEYAALDKIDAKLAQKIPVIINVDYVPNTPAIDEHWVLVVGKENGSYIINDPKDGAQLRFEDRYGDPKGKIYNVCTYNFTGNVAPIPQPEPEAVLFRVKVLIPDLRIRADADKDSAVVYRYATGEYEVYEEKNGYGRIGVGRWISLDPDYVKKLVTNPVEVTDSEKLQKLWAWYVESHGV